MLEVLEILNQLIDFLKTIPPTIWAVILGSTITLIGVMFSNKNNTKRLERQLEHDSLEKSKERKAELRSEIYLNATEELVKANSYLGSLTQVDITTTNIADGLQGFFISASKLSLISNQETALEVSKLVSIYGEIFFLLIEKILPMQTIMSEIKIRDNINNNIQNEINRILADMTQINESKNRSNNQNFDSLQQSFDFQQSESKKITEERSSLWKEYNILNMDYMKTITEEMIKIAEQQIPVFVGLREELELETDEKKYRELLQSQNIKLQQRMGSFIEKLESMYD